MAELMESINLNLNVPGAITFPKNIHQYLLIILLVAFLAWYVQYLWTRRKLYAYASKVYGPFAFPIIGCMYLFLGSPTKLVQTQMKLLEKWNGLCKLWFGPQLHFVMSRPEHVEKILNHPKAIEKDEFYRFIRDILGNGLLTAPARKWRHHRKVISPSFNQRILDSFVEIFAEQGIIFVEQLKKHAGRKYLDLYILASRCTLDIVCQTAMGVNMNIQTSNSDFGVVVEKMLEFTTYRLFRIWNHLDFVWKLNPMSSSFTNYVKRFHDVTSAVVRKKLVEYDKKMEMQESCMEAEIEEAPIKKRMAFLDLILENAQFSEEELQEEVDIFLIAGTETTASALCCIFTMLGMFPDVQQKVYDEVMDISGPDRTILASDLPKMKYTERVIKETLRLFPVAAFFARYLEEDIDIGDAILPSGCSVAFGVVHLHRSPKYWTEPLKFNPDRFLPEEIAKRHPCSYIPFSYGPRNCIGWRYAISNMKTVIGTVIRQFRIFTQHKSIEDIELKINLLLRMKDGPKVWIESR